MLTCCRPSRFLILIGECGGPGPGGRLRPPPPAIAREYRMMDDRAMDDPLQRVRPLAARRRLSMLP